jgi:DNA-binding GntR family transcriptional regulator
MGLLVQFGSLAGRKSVQQHVAIIAACERGAAAEAAGLVEENWLSLGHLVAASFEAEANQEVGSEDQRQLR